jgi:hypothetical protein
LTVVTRRGRTRRRREPRGSRTRFSALGQQVGALVGVPVPAHRRPVQAFGGSLGSSGAWWVGRCKDPGPWGADAQRCRIESERARIVIVDLPLDVLDGPLVHAGLGGCLGPGMDCVNDLARHCLVPGHALRVGHLVEVGK